MLVSVSSLIHIALIVEPSFDRRSVVAAAAAALTLTARPPTALAVLDVEAAIAESVAGAACPVQSCVDMSIDRLTEMLNAVSGMKKNAAGLPEQHTPIVSVRPIYGMGRTAALVPRYQIVYVVPHPVSETDYIRLMWLKDEKTGRVLAARGIDLSTIGGGISAPVARLASGVGSLGTRSMLGPPTLTADIGKGYVERGDVVVPYLYCSAHGLWEGKPFALCAESGGEWCEGSGLTPLPKSLDTRVRRPLEEIGQDLLQQLGVSYSS